MNKWVQDTPNVHVTYQKQHMSTAHIHINKVTQVI